MDVFVKFYFDFQDIKMVGGEQEENEPLPSNIGIKNIALLTTRVWT